MILTHIIKVIGALQVAVSVLPIVPILFFVVWRIPHNWEDCIFYFMTVGTPLLCLVGGIGLLRLKNWGRFASILFYILLIAQQSRVEMQEMMDINVVLACLTVFLMHPKVRMKFRENSGDIIPNSGK